MPTIVHIDISAEDTERAKQFYEKLFGWKIQLLPGPPEYYLIETADLKGNIGVGAGLSKRDVIQGPGINNFIGVSSVQESEKNVIALGGKVLQEMQAVPGWGFISLCMDTEKNVFGLFQEDANSK